MCETEVESAEINQIRINFLKIEFFIQTFINKNTKTLNVLLIRV